MHICTLTQEAWGWTAWRAWSLLSPEERSGGGYTYLTGFKLLLEDGPAAGRNANRGDSEQQLGDSGASSVGAWDRGNGGGPAEGSSELGHSPEVLRAALRDSLPAGLTAVGVVTDFLTAVRR